MKANDMIVFSFQSAYPSWEPNADGKQFLSNIQKFKKKCKYVYPSGKHGGSRADQHQKQQRLEEPSSLVQDKVYGRLRHWGRAKPAHC